MGSDRTFGQLVADYLVSAVEADGTFVRITGPDILVNTSTRTRFEARFGATQLLTRFRGASRPSRGVNLEGVPHAADIEREVRRLGLTLRHGAGRRRAARLTLIRRPGCGRPARQAAESLISSG